MAIIRQEFEAKETICGSCSEVIRRAAMKVDGVKDASFSYSTEKGHVTYDDSKTNMDEIFEKIQAKGYPCSAMGEPSVISSSDPGKPAEDAKSDEAAISPQGDATPDDGKCRCNGSGKAASMSTRKDAKADSAASPEEPEDGDDEYNDDDEDDTADDADTNAIMAKRARQNRMFAVGIMALGIIVLAYFALPAMSGLEIPQFTSTMGLGLLFLAGLLTGFHCIGMCGGFVVSYTAKNAQAGIKSYRQHLMYGAGKTLSYTVIGALFGLAGSIIAFTPEMRGAAAIIAGVFLLLYGLRMLNVHPIFRKFTIRTPVFVSKFVHKEENEHSNPMLIGLLNGLMLACGPLQAMYIMAAGTGSFVQGATLLFVFGLGTLPPMLGFGYFASTISAKMTHKILKFSGIVVMVLGVIMLNNGLALTGTGYDFRSVFTGVVAAGAPATGSGSIITAQGYQEIRMDVTKYGWQPDTFVLKKGVPVKWIINGKELNGCNKAIQVPKLGLKFDIKPGEQTIEFTPTEEGTIPFSCWMGMIQGRFIVKADIDVSNKTAVNQVISSAPPKAAGGSCGGGGGCGCGG